MNVPELRFKGFHKKWESNTIGEISNSYSGGTPSVGCNEFYGGDIPFIRSGEIYNDKTELHLTLKGLYSSSAKIVDKGTILYALYGATSGEVNICKIKGAINQAILAIIPKKKISSYYLVSLLRNKKTKIISSLLQGGQGNLSGALIKNYIIFFPELPEQQKIASYFQALDSLIQTTSKELESLKQIKAASLQSMFPQEGETIPKVRFKGFEGKWKNLTLGEIGKWSKGRLLSKSDLTADGKNPCIHYGELFVNYSEVINEVESYTNVDNGCYSEIGDILFPDSDVTATGLARCSAIMQNGVILGGGINILKVDKKFYSPYISYSINQEKGQIISRVIGTTVRHINSTALSEVQIAVPSDIKEQQQIADYFTCLDKQITLQAQRLEKLKQIKAACLDKMFV